MTARQTAFSQDDSHRLTLDVNDALYERVRAAAARGASVREFCVEALSAQATAAVAWDDEPSHDTLTAMTAADPVLAELWDNERDAAYDRL
jgi:hypothetical protein